MIDLFEDVRRSDTRSSDALDVLSQDAAHALLLDSPPDGKHVLWKVICVRVGIYGHFDPIRATEIFDLPPIIADGYETLVQKREGGYDGQA
ncbi:MAG TPA: hypothetical protein VGU68_15445 [Ktedonobacteraceae bacterium]|nr:hypothetical protein [Ktedonobacteraceae bacterium]